MGEIRQGASASADPRREALLASYDLLNDDGHTIASEAVASMARDPLRRVEPGEGRHSLAVSRLRGRTLDELGKDRLRSR